MKPAAAGLVFLSLVASAPGQSVAEWRELVRKPGIDLVRATALGLASAGSGRAYQAELELDGDKLVYSIDVAVGPRTANVVLDVQDGRVLATEDDDQDRSLLVAASEVPLAAAVATVMRRARGTPILAALRRDGERLLIEVDVFADGITRYRVDAVGGAIVEPAAGGGPEFTATFVVEPGELRATGSNPFFVLVPGHVLELEGEDGGQAVRLVVTVLDETRRVDGVEVRVVEERETRAGALVEVSRNFFAISAKTNSVYYFGEEVDIYEDGVVVRHDGAWESGKAGARFGLMMPGTVLLGSRYYQEIAPGVAMDRAEIARLDGRLSTPAGDFEGVLVAEESTDLEPGTETKYYARGIGLVGDAELRLVRVVK